MEDRSINFEQRIICQKYNADFLESLDDMIVGVSDEFRNQNNFPIHGLRHEPIGQTSGWYLWSGEYSDNDNFFKPLHLRHIVSINPTVLKYLGLGPGWRFLLADNYEDVWFDTNLLLDS